jgi:hypothetical protein
VDGTPAFFVNGRPLSGASYDGLARVVDEELQAVFEKEAGTPPGPAKEHAVTSRRAPR